MTTVSFIPKRILILGIVLPVAALLGYLLAQPADLRSIGTVGLVLGVIAIPLILRWHQPLLVFSWNAAINLAFLPGSPPLWMLMSVISLTLVLISVGLDRTTKLLHAPSVTWSLLVLAATVVLTAQLTGGMPTRSLGGSVYGGRKYYYILLAIVGYFALSSQRIPIQKASSYAAGFILSRITVGLGTLIYFFPALYFLYYVFATDYALNQAAQEMRGPMLPTVGRLTGVGAAAVAATTYLLLRHGVRGNLDLNRPWRLALLLFFFGLSLVGGYRSVIVVQVLLFAVLFFYEGLHRTRFLPMLVLVGGLVLAGLFVFGDRLPMSFQRSLAVLPIPIDPVARMDAQYSSEWRLRMWSLLFQQMPQYLLLGKGYVANAADYALVMESARRGFVEPWESSMLAGDFHNGPLSVLIPFGIWGLLAVGAFVIAGWRVLRQNYRYGDPRLHKINTFMLSMFVSQVILFVFIFGDLPYEMVTWAGLVGLSVSLNGGVCKAPSARPEGNPADA